MNAENADKNLLPMVFEKSAFICARSDQRPKKESVGWLVFK